MGFLAALNHVINFLAPALWMALLLPLLARFVIRNRSSALTLTGLVALNFIVGCTVLVVGLVVFGRDGKMLTYLALVLGVASSQWYGSRR
ncbi:hypothetical protein HUU62_23680 [Rhodoferax sp. 4810]|nr:hypothetical protein [Rhodoferax jenense]